MMAMPTVTMSFRQLNNYFTSFKSLAQLERKKCTS